MSLRPTALPLKRPSIFWRRRPTPALAATTPHSPPANGLQPLSNTTAPGPCRRRGGFTGVEIMIQTLASKRLLQERVSQIILAAAVTNDVLRLLILALVSNLAERFEAGDDVEQFLINAALAQTMESPVQVL